MKRDMDLVRELLLKVEEDGTPTLRNVPDLDGFEAETVIEHIRLLVEGGYVTAIDAGTFDGPDFIEIGMTWDGHDFLDKVRDEELWRETKDGAKKAGIWSISALGDIAVAIAKAKLAALGLPMS